jgi:hypothetical protein
MRAKTWQTYPGASGTPRLIVYGFDVLAFLGRFLPTSLKHFKALHYILKFARKVPLTSSALQFSKISVPAIKDLARPGQTAASFALTSEAAIIFAICYINKPGIATP